MIRFNSIQISTSVPAIRASTMDRALIRSMVTSATALQDSRDSNAEQVISIVLYTQYCSDK